ncbi:DsbA family oxidoreductase [Sulfitobacter mediterraneus]|uniref:DsbA family oxidoreductase n=1 Tax=Sulfitobacter mediterraneus TaxID=83219 RepID=UPI00193AC1C7|nr:DsbA family oxidoreductase [Sulfitobacter mediterraneus]MBM1558267.1 DsbA family oxidoreductase [Sulfitobacter mediterraneus]MBM1568633.1 DsbA family oxidoreductase [Sulfitobacter mediterraneus]MBM1573473.1 DsbA family oxidoreductase [Sulfitobacter mediterraneus]MBM1576366.1 DsbA family oxidoreductase [Sulfitobacter mediterraneus]MBM1581256.1 DsbA family oxidoreductase [Sulfitobacter mediterraneus]
MSDQTPKPDAPVIQIDIVSDVMCPWCIVGFKQLEQALGMTGVGAYIRWHPFELNPAMPAEGQNLTEHIAEKYGASAEQSAQNRKHLVDLGQSLGFAFNFGPDSRIVNTFAAHQLLDWAQEHGLQHPLKMALFAAHFQDGKDVSTQEVLLDTAQSVGLDRDAAAQVLESGSHAEETRARQQFWTSRGISGVPSMVFSGKYLLTGAQGAENYAQMLMKVVQEADEAA